MRVGIVSGLALITSLLVNPSNANELYLTQSGNNFYLLCYQEGAGTYFESDILGDDISLTFSQKDYGISSAWIDLYGDGHTVTAIQEGGGDHTLDINLYNSGGAYNFSINQNSSSNLNYSVTSYCTNLNGCSLSIIQN